MFLFLCGFCINFQTLRPCINDKLCTAESYWAATARLAESLSHWVSAKSRFYSIDAIISNCYRTAGVWQNASIYSRLATVDLFSFGGSGLLLFLKPSLKFVREDKQSMKFTIRQLSTLLHSIWQIFCISLNVGTVSWEHFCHFLSRSCYPILSFQSADIT